MTGSGINNPGPAGLQEGGVVALGSPDTGPELDDNLVPGHDTFDIDGIHSPPRWGTYANKMGCSLSVWAYVWEDGLSSLSPIKIDQTLTLYVLMHVLHGF